MTEPKISVIVPCYNCENTIEATLASILASTVSELEVILVNDGSTDNTADLLYVLSRTDGRIVVINKENGGVSSARNAALDVARGEYIGFVDSDDIIDPDMYEYLLSAISRGADIAECGMRLVSSDGEQYTTSPECEISTEKGIAAEREWLSFFTGSSCTKLFSREVVGDTRFFTDYKIGEDMLFNLLCLERSRRATILPEAKYSYIQNDTSATHKAPTEDSLMSYLYMIDYAKERFSAYPELMAHLGSEELKSCMDSASKLELSGTQLPAVKSELIRRTRLGHRSGFCSEFGFKDRLKIFLISYLYPIYKIVIRLMKGGRK